MKRPLLQFILCILTVVALPGRAQEISKTDCFVGEWTLKAESAGKLLRSERLRIQKRGTEYYIFDEISYPSGTVLRMKTTTSMDGRTSQLYLEDGRIMNESWAFTKDGDNAFIVRKSPFRAVLRYAVDSSGNHLTVEQLSSDVVGAPTSARQKKKDELVFKRNSSAK